MSVRYSPAFFDYSQAFKNPDEPFLFTYRFEHDKGMSRLSLTRGEFLSLARKAASALKDHGQGKGSKILHCFGDNDCHDLAFRVAGALMGTIPVTVNWQDDPLERVIYKYHKTGASMVVESPSFDAELCEALKVNLQGVPFFNTEELEEQQEIPWDDCLDDIDHEFTRIIIFTSGTTGHPKGVQLPYRSYRNNRAALEQMLDINESDHVAALVVNPLHHANSTAITDWMLRRSGSHIHLIERYATQYWAIVHDVAAMGYDCIVAPTVSRHFDFLEELATSNRLPMGLERLQHALSKVDFLLGSAPVGPTTVARLRKYAGRTPLVRFGATETCLQVMGIPRSLSDAARLEIFERGWKHQIKGEPMPGYYIGRPHKPHTAVRIVKGIARTQEGYLEDVVHGIPGYLITRGDNVMTGYVDDPKATAEVLEGEWYMGLKDIGFALENHRDGQLDYFWVSRDSSLLIRGGANYSCDQINAQLSDFVVQHYKLPRESFSIAVVGLRIDSEHEDACCVTIELIGEAAQELRGAIEASFIEKARVSVSKGARPDYLRFAAIPKTFKGSILMAELKKEYLEHLAHSEGT
jgi:acyl-CoA synthetase (AMP-forming)/AMP-acid ligase II